MIHYKAQSLKVPSKYKIDVSYYYLWTSGLVSKILLPALKELTI